MAKPKHQKVRKAVIPVAGVGTRFLPATIAQPKEMLTVVDKPVIQYIVEEMAASGIEEIIFVTGRNKRAIEDHFDYPAELEQTLRENKKFDALKEVHRISRLAKFVYVRQNKALGTGHALMMARELIGDEPFAFTYGDDIIVSKTPAIRQLVNVFHRQRSSVIGTLLVPPGQAHRYGIMKPAGAIRGRTFRISGLVEKPKDGEAPSRFFSPGRMILTPEIFKFIEKVKLRNGEMYLADAVNLLARRQPVFAHHIAGRYFDCGSKTEYVKANVYFALKHRDIAPEIGRYIKRPT